jgi:hypothetical protein
MNIVLSTAFIVKVASFIRTSAPTVIFGDKRKREAYTTEEAREVFIQVWEADLKQAVMEADFWTKEATANYLREQGPIREFDENQHHKSVTYLGIPFLAQLFELDKEKQEYELDHLWYEGPREVHGPEDYDPRYM